MICLRQNTYEIEKNVEKVLDGNNTGFLTNSVCLEVKKKLKRYNYNVFCPFGEAEKVILYGKDMPRVKLFRIDCYKDDEIRHSSVLGSLFGLNITSEMFGDIVKYEGNFYVYLLDSISELVVNELRMIGRVPVKLVEVDLDFLSNFKREYERFELIVSSLRIDTVIARLIGCNRDGVCDKIKNQEIFVNEEVVKKASVALDIGDLFSIRKYGKFCFRDVIGRTKKGNYVIAIDKYV